VSRYAFSQSASLKYIWNIALPSKPGLPSHLSPSDFPPKTLYVYLITPKHLTCLRLIFGPQDGGSNLHRTPPPLSLWLYNPLKLGRYFSFLILYAVGRTPWTGDQPVARPLPIHRTTQAQNKCTRTCMTRVGFEPTTPVFKREKTVHALDCAATVIG
jgi:hypothetical protein